MMDVSLESFVGFAFSDPTTVFAYLTYNECMLLAREASDLEDWFNNLSL
jgi:hypothetical protein